MSPVCWWNRNVITMLSCLMDRSLAVDNSWTAMEMSENYPTVTMSYELELNLGIIGSTVCVRSCRMARTLDMFSSETTAGWLSFVLNDCKTYWRLLWNLWFQLFHLFYFRASWVLSFVSAINTVCYNIYFVFGFLTGSGQHWQVHCPVTTVAHSVILSFCFLMLFNWPL